MPHRNASLAISFASAGVSFSSVLVAAITGKPGTIAIATMSAVRTKIVGIRMLFIPAMTGLPPHELPLRLDLVGCMQDELRDAVTRQRDARLRRGLELLPLPVGTEVPKTSAPAIASVSFFRDPPFGLHMAPIPPLSASISRMGGELLGLR
jgi:hypothetical protein